MINRNHHRADRRKRGTKKKGIPIIVKIQSETFISEEAVVSWLTKSQLFGRSSHFQRSLWLWFNWEWSSIPSTLILNFLPLLTLLPWQTPHSPQYPLSLSLPSLLRTTDPSFNHLKPSPNRQGSLSFWPYHFINTHTHTHTHTHTYCQKT